MLLRVIVVGNSNSSCDLHGAYRARTKHERCLLEGQVMRATLDQIDANAYIYPTRALKYKVLISVRAALLTKHQAHFIMEVRIAEMEREQ